MDFKLSTYHIVTKSFIDKTDGYAKRIIFATRTAEICVVSETAWKIIKSEQFELLPKETLFGLIDIELIVPKDENELSTILDRNDSEAADDDILYLVVQPSALCQLGCDYCGQQHVDTLLSKENQIFFVDRIRQKLQVKKFQKLIICWFGAEPILGISVIRTLTPKFKALAESFNCIYESKVVTNGLALTDKIATELVNEHNVKFIEVTLDGIAEFHNSRRHKKNGAGSFTQIFNNVINLAKREDLSLDLRIRCNVDRRNYEGVSPLLRMLAKAEVQKLISFYVAPIHSWGNSAHHLSFSAEDFAALEIEWSAQMIKLGFEPILKPQRKPVVCLAVRPFGELVDANGSLFNCTEVSYVPTYGSPNKYTIGDVHSGEIKNRRGVLGNFNNRIRQGEYSCSSCQMLPVCGGSCPKQWQEGLHPCPSTKYNIEDRLLLIYASSRINHQLV